MHRKFVFALLIILLLVLILKFFRNIITGFVTLVEEVALSLNITEVTQGKIIYLVYPPTVVKGSVASFYVNFQNTGNQNITARIEMHVLNSANVVISSFYDENVTLEPLEIRSFFSSLTLDETGKYLLNVRVPYDGKIEEENRSFEVILPFLPIYYPLYAYLPPIPPIIPTIINLTLLYPKQINLTQNESSLIYLYAINFGNVDLHNLSLFGEVEGIEWSVKPEKLPLLPVRSSVLFLISVKAPPDAESKDYIFNFEMRSDETTQRGKVTITVFPLEICPEVERAIKSYALLIDRVSSEIEKAAKQGVDVRLASYYLEKAKHALEIAKELYRLNDCRKAKESLGEIKYYLEKAIIELVRMIPAPFPYFILLYLLFIVLAFILLIFLIRRIRRKKKKERVEEVERIRERKRKLQTLVKRRSRVIETLEDIKRAFDEGRVSKKFYLTNKERIESEIERIEEEIITKFGNEEQAKSYNEIKNVLRDGKIKKEMYSLARKRIVEEIISK